MGHVRPRNPEDRRRALVLKESLRSLHVGAGAIPRKQIFLSLPVSETTYSRWLNPEEHELPDVLEVMAIVSISGNPAPLRAMAANCGEGWEVEAAGQLAEPLPSQGNRLLAEVAQVDARHLAGLAEDLADGRIDADEASRRLIDARDRLLQAQREVDFLQQVANGRTTPLRAVR